MNNQLVNILRKAAEPNRTSYNILTFDTHERYQTQLGKTGHDFFAFIPEGAKQWNTTFAPKPSNYYTLPNNAVYPGLEFDFILSQSKFGQIQTARQIQGILNIPIISLEHTLPIDGWQPEQLAEFRRLTGDINVFISEYSAKQWQIEPYEVVHHSVDTDLFKPAQNSIKTTPVLSVVNDFIKRDYCCNFTGWQRITEGLNAKVVGETEGLSKPATNVEELVTEYQSAQVFLNTSTISPVPTALLEAMSCGVPVVSTATCMIPDIIENGVNGFMSNDEKEIRGFLDHLLREPALREEIGAQGRQTVCDKFSEQNFVNKWNNIFESVYRIKK
jgi:hypothetical protein